MDDFLAKQRETQESDTGGGFFVRQAVVWGGCVGLLYGATDVLQMIFKEKTSLFEHVAAQTPYIGLMLLGYAAVHALALAAWTGCLVWAHRLRRVAFSRERWVRVGFGGFVGFAAWLIALNLAGICVEREALKHWREGLSDRTLRDGCLVVWTFVAAGAVGWGAVRGFGALESLRKAAVARMRAKVVRRAFALVAAVAIVSVFVVQVVMPMASRHAAKRNKHNVLLITVDTLRPDYLSCGGSSKVRTEHLDALANGGVLFETVISHAPWTRPSVATLLTGRYPSVHDAGRTVVAKGRLQDPMHGVRRSVPMLAEMLSAAHFTTQAFVTNAHLREEFGFGRGFGDFYHFDVGAGTKERSRYARRFERAILLDGLSRHLRLYPLRDAPELVIPPRPDKPERSAFPDSAEDVVTTASDWLAQFEARREGRFFLWLHFMDAHEYAAYHAVPQGAAENECPFAIRAFPKEEDREHATVEHHERVYRDNVAYVDWTLGQLFSRMKGLGLYDKTLIIVTADHGEEFGEHGGMRHAHSLHDEVIRVPLILSLPGVLPAGKRVERQARLVDIVPTVLDVVGVRPPPDLDGKSLLALLTPGAEEGERDAFSEFLLFGSEEQKSLRTGRFKIIYTFETRRIKLFDLQDDPQERENVAKDHVAVASRLLKRLDEWVKETRRAAGAAERPGDTVVVSHEKEIIERLKALGYVKE